MSWTSKTTENRLLEAYAVREGALIYAEVPFVGRDGHGVDEWRGSGRRLFDGVRFEAPQIRGAVVLYRDARSECDDGLAKAPVTIIEVKRKLNRGVIGQIIVGRRLFTRQFKRSPAKSVIVCQKTDPALEWVCGKENIQVVEIPIKSATRPRKRRAP